jgi:hypothetical protein
MLPSVRLQYILWLYFLEIQGMILRLLAELMFDTNDVEVHSIGGRLELSDIDLKGYYLLSSHSVSLLGTMHKSNFASLKDILPFVSPDEDLFCGSLCLCCRSFLTASGLVWEADGFRLNGSD